MAVSSNPIKKIGLGPEPYYDCKFKGLSSDEKPTENVPANSLFWELDTDEYYYFKKGSKEVIFIEEYTFDNWTQYGNGYLRYPYEDTLSFGDKVKIMWDGQEYECTKQEGGLGYGYYGAPVDFSDPYSAVADFSVYPFGFYLNNEEGTAKVTISETDGSHTYAAYTESIVPDTWEKLATNSGGGGGGSDIACLKLKFESQNQTFSLMDISGFLAGGDILILNEYGALSDFVYTADLYNVPSGTELRLLQMADHDGESIIRYYSIGGESQPEGIKDMVNLEWGQPEGFYSLVPVDPTKPSSATWNVDLDINGGGGGEEVEY